MPSVRLGGQSVDLCRRPLDAFKSDERLARRTSPDVQRLLGRASLQSRFRDGLVVVLGLVVLCADYRCKGAERALRRAGYKPELKTLTLLRSEGVRVWVKIYKVDTRTV